MTRLALASLPLLAACQSAAPPANTVAAPQAKAAQAPDDRAIAEQVVRRRLRGPAGLVFSNARVIDAGRVPIVCGDVEHRGRRERYIVVDGEMAYVESQMGAGEMDRAIRENCGGGELG